jgi:hypothetical protein
VSGITNERFSLKKMINFDETLKKKRDKNSFKIEKIIKKVCAN